MNQNPNNIIALLLDISSAAYMLMHTHAKLPGDTVLVRQDDADKLMTLLHTLDSLPQPRPGGHLTGPACAREYLKSFLQGQVAPSPLEEKRAIAAIEHEMRVHQDADLLAQLRSLCGYVENGSSETVHIGQDDATRDWFLSVGYNSMGGKKRSYTSTSFHQVIRVAAEAEIEKEECAYCGMSFEFPCDEPPSGVCEKAINAFYGDPTKPRATQYTGTERRHRPRFITATSVSGDPAFAYTDKTGRYLNRGERMQERHVHDVKKLVKGDSEEP